MPDTDEKPGQKAAPTEESPWWRDGVVVFSEVTGWIVVPLISALYLGQYLDEHQGTGNLYFLGLTAIAFLISCTGIGIIGVKYIKKVEKQHSIKKDIDHDRSNGA